MLKNVVLFPADASRLAVPAKPVSRIVVANHARLFRQLLRRTLETLPEFQVMGETVNTHDLLDLVERDRPHWIVASLLPDGQLPILLEALLIQFPSLKILGVSADGQQVQTRGAQLPREETFDDPSLDDVIRILNAGLRDATNYQA